MPNSGCGKQFGFRSGHGTGDALFAARRLVEAAWETRDGKLVLLELGWAKAFDSVSPQALCCGALRRFRVPPEFVQMVEGIYADYSFVQDRNVDSAMEWQQFGIS